MKNFIEKSWAGKVRSEFDSIFTGDKSPPAAVLLLSGAVFNIYELTTDDGPLTVQSTAVLMNRISELRALAAMEEINQGGEFGEGLVEGVKAPVRGAANLVTSPIETLGGSSSSTIELYPW